jgi:hypothetical protein
MDTNSATVEAKNRGLTLNPGPVRLPQPLSVVSNPKKIRFIIDILRIPNCLKSLEILPLKVHQTFTENFRNFQPIFESNVLLDFDQRSFFETHNIQSVSIKARKHGKVAIDFSICRYLRDSLNHPLINGLVDLLPEEGRQRNYSYNLNPNKFIVFGSPNSQLAIHKAILADNLLVLRE